jgi:ELWxxDGT repeat protein
MYFAANNGVNGRELWITDGTASGTQMIFDINPGALESIPSHFQIMGNVLYFFAETQTSGRELFKLPLTTSSTHHSISQLPLSLYPTLSSEGTFYFDYSGDKSEAFDIAIFDALGRMSYQIKQTLDTPLRLSALSTGTYLARITAKDGRFAAQKFVIGQ